MKKKIMGYNFTPVNKKTLIDTITGQYAIREYFKERNCLRKEKVKFSKLTDGVRID